MKIIGRDRNMQKWKSTSRVDSPETLYTKFLVPVPTVEVEGDEAQRQSPILHLRRESRMSIASSRRNSRVLQNDLLLHEAVIKNETDAVQRILGEPVDVNSRNNYGRAPIHWASSRGSIDIMELLINAKCDIEVQDKYGMRPILMAAWHGSKEAVELLINCGANVSVVNKKKHTLLICAAKNNRVDIINFLLDILEDVKLDEIDLDHQTALYHAAAGGHLETVQRLVDIGASLNVKDKNRRTPLHAAVEKGHASVVEFLLQRNADKESRDNEGNVPLHLSAENKQTRTTQVLLDYGSPPEVANEKGLTPLHIACSLGCHGIIDLLIKHGANVNAQSKAGETPLHLACRNNELDVVERLIEEGVDVNLINSRLESAIHVAAERGHSEICKVLLSAGSNIRQREQGGKTPLYIAARGSFTAIVDMIIKTARLDYFSPEEDDSGKDPGDTRPKSLKGKNDDSKSRNEKVSSEELRNLLHRVAYKHLRPGEWKRLAKFWEFTDDQIQAIEHQYNGTTSYKEHGFRILLIWAHGLGPDTDAISCLCDSLIAINNGKVADAVRKLSAKNEKSRSREQKLSRCSCCVS